MSVFHNGNVTDPTLIGLETIKVNFGNIYLILSKIIKILIS